MIFVLGFRYNIMNIIRFFSDSFWYRLCEYVFWKYSILLSRAGPVTAWMVKRLSTTQSKQIIYEPLSQIWYRTYMIYRGFHEKGTHRYSKYLLYEPPPHTETLYVYVIGFDFSLLSFHYKRILMTGYCNVTKFFFI